MLREEIKIKKRYWDFLDRTSGGKKRNSKKDKMARGNAKIYGNVWSAKKNIHICGNAFNIGVKDCRVVNPAWMGRCSIKTKKKCVCVLYMHFFCIKSEQKKKKL